MVDACCIFFWLSDAGWIEEDIERKQGGKIGDNLDSPPRGDEDLFGGSGKKRADTRATLQVELTFLPNIPYLPTMGYY